MGNQVLCSEGKLKCTENCTRVQVGEHKEPTLDEANRCDPAGAVFAETVEELNDIDRQLLLFSCGTNAIAVRWLLQLGASRLVCDSNGTTCLHAACRSGSAAIVDTFIRLDQDVPATQGSLTAVDAAGWTPLHTAAFMGRAEIVARLLHAGVPVDRRTSAGKLAADLCNDARTRSLLTIAAGQGAIAKAHIGKVDAARAGFEGGSTGLSVEQVMVGGKVSASREVRFEPFFVPRQPVMRDTMRSPIRRQLMSIGRSIFDRQPGRGLAFLVATGCVRDYPMDLVDFLRQSTVDLAQIGTFLGEDFSLSKILRMEFLNALGFTSCGVVACLKKAFASFKMPPDLQKVDRILHSLAEVWWRQHSKYFSTTFPDLSSEEEALRQVAAAFATQALGPAEAKAASELEPDGFEVRRLVKSSTVMHHLFFSSTMLAWNCSATLPKSQRMSLATWLQLHQDPGTTAELPSALLTPIYNAISTASDMPDVWIQSSREGLEPVAPDGTLLASHAKVEGWVRIRGDGLPTLLSSVGGNSTAPAADCLQISGMLSESTASSRWRHPDRHLLTSRGSGASRPMQVLGESKDPVPARGRDSVWLSLCCSLLFLSTGPESTRTPFAFVQLDGAKLSGIEPSQAVFAIEGRSEGEGPPDLALGPLTPAPAGLQLVLLLPDGRWQHYTVPKLVVEVCERPQLESWVLHLNDQCTAPAVSLLSV